MYPQFYSYHRINHDIHIVNDIAKAINGEYSAIACYAQLAEIAPTEKEKKRILEIREDEIRHYQIFSAIYMNLTGKQPTPQINETCPKVYKEGLEFAIEDEQKTVDFYLDISDKAQDSYTKKQFRRAAADEQNHAVWFLYLYTKFFGR
ncbi:ferritin-like domain-containing protein [Ectobacillus panaciterrae]|uniref:ferritin-like domain-containing protein n=1 Tax=Ectobacillus panaciterrae TaxID=363872 RepID=UPI0003FA1347|nr:ferritin-like domain-containing protein [Ectobacillus panaciterrae]